MPEDRKPYEWGPMRDAISGFGDALARAGEAVRSSGPGEPVGAAAYGLVPGALYRIDLNDCCVGGVIFRARFVGLERRCPEGISVEMEHVVFDCVEFTTMQGTYFERIDEGAVGA